MDHIGPVLAVTPGETEPGAPFKGCQRWNGEIHRLSEEVGVISSRRKPGDLEEPGTTDIIKE